MTTHDIDAQLRAEIGQFLDSWFRERMGKLTAAERDELVSGVTAGALDFYSDEVENEEAFIHSMIRWLERCGSEAADDDARAWARKVVEQFNDPRLIEQEAIAMMRLARAQGSKDPALMLTEQQAIGMMRDTKDSSEKN